MFLFFLNYSSELRRSGSWSIPLTSLFAVSMLPQFEDYSISVGVLNMGSYYADYYESLADSSMSDIHGLYLSYYTFNSPLLVLFGFFIFVVSVVCVVLLRAAQSSYSEAVGELLGSYSFFGDLVSFELLRSQNLNMQSLRSPIGRSLGRPPKGWSRRRQD